MTESEKLALLAQCHSEIERAQALIDIAKIEDIARRAELSATLPLIFKPQAE
jgi:hypothetical protein